MTGAPKGNNLANNPYYVICKSGMRSARACQFLAEQGYEVINVLGGMDAFE